jgi:hypothetical protein
MHLSRLDDIPARKGAPMSVVVASPPGKVIDQDQSGGLPTQSAWARTVEKEQAMPIGDMLFVSVVIIAFGIFAVVLGWTDYRTRGIGQ